METGCVSKMTELSPTARLVAYAILALLVHPRDEPLDRSPSNCGTAIVCRRMTVVCSLCRTHWMHHVAKFMNDDCSCLYC